MSTLKYGIPVVSRPGEIIEGYQHVYVDARVGMLLYINETQNLSLKEEKLEV